MTMTTWSRNFENALLVVPHKCSIKIYDDDYKLHDKDDNNDNNDDKNADDVDNDNDDLRIKPFIQYP